MQAIQTKYISATNTRGSRIRAKCARGSITVSWSYDLTEEANHVEAVRVLTDRFVREDAKNYGTPVLENPWNKEFVTGCLPDGNYAHVFSSNRARAQF
jgi:hypothetical protein